MWTQKPKQRKHVPGFIPWMACMHAVIVCLIVQVAFSPLSMVLVFVPTLCHCLCGSLKVLGWFAYGCFLCCMQFYYNLHRFSALIAFQFYFRTFFFFLLSKYSRTQIPIYHCVVKVQFARLHSFELYWHCSLLCSVLGLCKKKENEKKIVWKYAVWSNCECVCECRWD